MEKLKASSLQELRDKGGDAVIAAGIPSRPNVDGYVLPKPPAEVYRSGEEMRVPILVGSNAVEGTPYPVEMTAEAFKEDARKRYGERADALLKLYPASNDPEARASSYALHRDRRICRTRLGVGAVTRCSDISPITSIIRALRGRLDPINSRRRPRI